MIEKTQVVIVGAGPAGLLLGQLLHNAGIEHVILERRSPEYVLGRIRAGMLETRTVDTLNQAGVGDRLARDGLPQTGFHLLGGDHHVRISFDAIGKETVVYGQTEITRDLMDRRETLSHPVRYEVDEVALDDIETDQPRVTYRQDGVEREIACEFVAGCDGFHGISRRSIPRDIRQEYVFAYPFGWLGLLSDTRPVSDEVVWLNHEEGFLMCSLRSRTRSRYYLQVPIDEKLENWSEDRFWTSFHDRLPDDLKGRLETGPALEMSIAPLRSFVSEPMRHGRLLLAGDAAHVVPPTGAKGLNLAVADVREMADALTAFYARNDESYLQDYSRKALERVWLAVRFSWWMTTLMHKFSDDEFERKIKLTELGYIGASEAAQITIAENFCGFEQ